MPIQSHIIKFYPPPDNCDHCWKERKKFFRGVLSKMSFSFKNRDLEIHIIGICHDEKKDKLDEFLKSEFAKMKKSYVRIKYVQKGL